MSLKQFHKICTIIDDVRYFFNLFWHVILCINSIPLNFFYFAAQDP